MHRGALALIGALSLGATAAGQPAPSAEDRALRFLSREVPNWSRQNHCFSCHNNGDAARALYGGLRAGLTIEPAALTETTAWLAAPGRWDHNGGDGPFSDKRLSRIQFTAALTAAREAAEVRAPEPLREAAARLARDQAADGSWPLEGDNRDGPGSPAAYGRSLATHLARESLRSADPVRFREPVERARRWLAAREIRTVGDASVGLLALGRDPSVLPRIARESCLDVLRRGQSDDGGWGPFIVSPPEVFDTSLAVLGLCACPLDEGSSRMIERGRGFLIALQQPDGSWPATTRPPGGESYAQRISTCGWATLALLASRPALPGPRPDPKR
jgi:hypothetical protein